MISFPVSGEKCQKTRFLKFLSTFLFDYYYFTFLCSNFGFTTFTFTLILYDVISRETSRANDFINFDATLISSLKFQNDKFNLQALTLSLPETKLAEFANSTDLDEMAHNESSHHDLHLLPSRL